MRAKRNEDVYLYEKYGFKQSYSQMKLYETFKTQDIDFKNFPLPSDCTFRLSCVKNNHLYILLEKDEKYLLYKNFLHDSDNGVKKVTK